ncbi:GntR family transcriptional regulator [Paucilactobacillus oligofermentans DSM 15707 = LMG 22743]|uniref:GntR family transcriptional regulator n=1 Tax=Paucilactobacillus oligofermentans DSM 15707 = LMG 22743 TaxID=1423778 RepID=A0A0R1RMT6_9LACO|nr:GntR family transcriptional regulator [Paucilactobacillus oligofermentans]KRL55397.1 GntR family transcriptional regulator [Paucilactobacillus oligofermentans DSM 15707 = LMG 22743]CUS25613.1 GntR family transcriptional regulator [Paucilactobacillus oligofermentans DSM 15707 = LMG 22743]
MQFDDKVPIYYQIKKYLYKEIIIEHLNPGDKLPAVRQLAVDLTVNVNTIQRAISELVEEGIIVTQRGKGNFVTTDMEKLFALKRHVVEEQIEVMYNNLTALQVSPDEVLEYLTTYIGQRKEQDNG